MNAGRGGGAPPEQRRIVLTGFMCAGKTTIGRALAARLGGAMLDTDAALSEREGRSIEAILDGDGEPRFRQLERDALRAILEGERARIIALGGGTWTLRENRALIAEHDCLVVWLDAPFELCWQRITHSPDARPLARNRDRARSLYHARRAAYALSTFRVEITEARSAEDTAAEIASIIGQWNFSDGHEGREEENTHG